MRSLLFCFILILLWSCQNNRIPQTPKDLLELSISNSSNNDDWAAFKFNSQNMARTTKIAGKIVRTTQHEQFFKYPGYERNNLYANDKLDVTEFYSPEKNLMINYNGDKKGYTNIPEKEVLPSPVFELLNDIQNLILSDTTIGFEHVYKLTNMTNNHVYVFNQNDFLLISRETKTNYGWQTETFYDYKNIDGYMIPTKITRSIPESAYLQEDIITDIEVNTLFSDDIFVIDESDRKIIVGNSLPEFSFEDFDQPNTFITNTSLKGKTVLIDFWATWCGPCIKEIPNIETLYQKYQKEGFEVVSVSLDTNKDLVDAFRSKQFNLPWKNTILTKGFKDPQIITMEVSALPKVILINPEGKIIATDENAKGEQLEAFLNKLYTK